MSAERPASDASGAVAAPTADAAEAERRRGRLRTLHEKFIVEERYVRPADRRSLYVLSAVAAVVGLALFSVILTGVVSGTGVASLDEPVRAWFTAQRNATATPTMVVLALVFGPVGMPIVVLVVTVAWTIRARHAWRPLLLAGGMLLGVCTALTVAPIVGRERPPVDLMLIGPDRTFSFPSGHVLGVCDFLLIGAFLVVSRRGGRLLAVIGFVVALLGIVVQIASRLYLGYHWLTDTLASFSLSLVVTGIVVAVDTWRTVRVPGEPVEGPLSVEAGPRPSATGAAPEPS